MNNQKDKHTRLERRKKRKEDRFLNMLIAAVVVAIIIIAVTVLTGDKEKSKEEPVKDDDQEIIEPQDEQEELNEPEEDATEGKEEEEQSEADEKEDIEEPADVEVTEDPNDPVVSKSIVDPAWAPIGTSQQGEHVSLYDGNSLDWQEKLQALTYTTGLPADDMIVWKLKNGGSPQKSIGIVSSKDKAEKYRVYLEWVDGEGWQPVQMDLLETLDFDY